jgi:hypothetical protein
MRPTICFRLEGFQFSHQALTQVEVDRTPVVRIHKAQVPQFGALVDIRNARGGEFQQGLRQRC